MRRIAALAALLLAACDAAPPQPVTVYVPTEYEIQASEWLPESGLDVTVVAADSRQNVDRIIAKEDSPRADVLITLGVHDIWRAGDQGALRPLQGAAFETIPPALRDPDGSWVAMGFQSAMIAHAADAPEAAVSSYADLGRTELSGQLCLTSSHLSSNRALIGMLIEELGVKRAERVVRSWVRNFAQPPFASEAELHDALASGECSYAISSAFTDDHVLTLYRPDPVYFDIQGIGIARHAENPDAARDLIDWILAEIPNVDPPPDSRNIGVAGWRDEEARLLAERAGYW